MVHGVISRACWAAGLLVLAAGATHAQQRPAYAAAAASEVRPLGPAQRLERHFLQVTAGHLRYQADASQLAAARSTNAAVKSVAQALLARHQTLHPELLRLLQARGMAMPLLAADHHKVLRQLGKLNGAKFDRLYLEEVMQRSLQADLALFEKVVAQAEDPVLKAWAERQLPLLRTLQAQVNRALPPVPTRTQRAG